MRRGSPPAIAAAVAAAGALLFAAPARAGDGCEPDDLPWFAGALVGAATIHLDSDPQTGVPAEKDRGMQLTAEGGKLLTPWLAAAFSVRFGGHRDQFHGDPVHDPIMFLAGNSYELGFGPRLYVLPFHGRLRIGFGISKLLSWQAEELDPRGNPGFIVRSTLTADELYVGVVPYRRGALELELGATRTSADPQTYQRLTWYALGIGLRWRVPGRAAPAARPQSTPP